MGSTFSGTAAAAGTNNYCTSTEVKAVMPDTTWGSTYDAMLTTLCSRASRLIDGLLKRNAGAFYVTADSTLYLDGAGERELWTPELAAAPTSVSVSSNGSLTVYTAWAATDYICWPYNWQAMGVPITRLDIDSVNGTQTGWWDYPKSVKIVGRLGFSITVPDEIKQAAIIQTTRWFKRGQQAYKDVGAIAELGQLQYVQKLDPDIAATLEIPKFQLVTL